MEAKGINKTLDASGKAKLIQWMLQHRDMCDKCTALEIVAAFKAETGLVASENSVNTYRVAVYPEMKPHRKECATANGGVLLGMIVALTRRVETLESFKQKFGD